MRTDFDRCPDCHKIAKTDRLSTAPIWEMMGLVKHDDRCHCKPATPITKDIKRWNQYLHLIVRECAKLNPKFLQ